MTSFLFESNGSETCFWKAQTALFAPRKFESSFQAAFQHAFDHYIVRCNVLTQENWSTLGKHF